MFYTKMKEISLSNDSTSSHYSLHFCRYLSLSLSLPRTHSHAQPLLMIPMVAWKIEWANSKEKIASKCVHLQLQTLTINADFTRGGFFPTFFFVFAIIGMFITFEWTLSHCSYIVAHYQRIRITFCSCAFNVSASVYSRVYVRCVCVCVRGNDANSTLNSDCCRNEGKNDCCRKLIAITAQWCYKQISFDWMNAVICCECACAYTVHVCVCNEANFDSN